MWKIKVKVFFMAKNNAVTFLAVGIQIHIGKSGNSMCIEKRLFCEKNPLAKVLYSTHVTFQFLLL